MERAINQTSQPAGRHPAGEAEIDRLVHALYGLTAVAIAIVAGQGN